ncbi:MAG: PPOX class F420-dependent oxidoreductase [Anaerolineae bacterium]|nr:PPOX class F420-dependent oxidoreductase [Anaerolineae bacterium]
MSVVIPESHRELVEAPVFVVLTTILPSGKPHSSVVWRDYDGEYIRVNTTTGRLKYKNMRQNPYVNIVAVHPDNPYYWMEIRGEVVEMTEEGGVDHIHHLSKMYTGQQYYGGYTSAERESQETRVICKIKPTHVTTYGKKNVYPGR